MHLMEPFATVDDLMARWDRALSDADQFRATVLLGDASLMLRRRYPTIDDDIASGAIDARAAMIAVVAMVKRAMFAEGQEGVDQFSQTAGPFAESFRYTNPNGNLYITDNDLWAWFGIRSGRALSVWVQ